MRVTLDWLQLLVVLAAAQGILLCGVLFMQHGNRTANRILGALMFASSVFLAGSVYFSADLYRVYPHFVGVSYQTPWLFGPLLYLYALAASDRAWRFRRRQTLHFLPAAVSLLATIPYFMMSGEEKVAVYDRMSRNDFPLLLSIIDPFKYLAGIGYTVATVLYLNRHRRAIENSYSNTEQVNLSWLMLLTSAAVGIWALAVSLKLAGFAGRLRDDHIALAISVLIYGIGYMGLRQPEIFRYETAEYPIPEEAITSAAQYQRSGLSDRDAKQLKEALLAVMGNEQPWKNSDLTLSDLATRLAVTPHNLSEVLNLEIGQTFYDFVNGYRVREVQRRIALGEAKALKMLSLALDAGFASKSTFNQAFKKHTSQTPSDYRQAIGA